MKLQELINETDLVMTLPQIKAYFLGILNAEKPVAFDEAKLEVIEDEKNPALETALKALWEEMIQKKVIETKNLFPSAANDQAFLSVAREQLDFFLTGMNIAGTHGDACKDEDVAELIEELEDTVIDLDEYLSVEKPDKEDTEELKSFLLETWKDFLSTKKF